MISSSEFKLQYISDYYDGPLKGYIVYSGAIHYFQVREFETYVLKDDSYDEYVMSQDRNFNVYALDVEEIIEYRRMRNLFELMVGYHNSYDESEQPIAQFAHSRQSEKFYAEENNSWLDDINWDERIPVGQAEIY